MATLGSRGAALLREVDCAPSDRNMRSGTLMLRPYNEDLVRQILDEVDEHHRSIVSLVSMQPDADAGEGTAQDEGVVEEEALRKHMDGTGILVHHQALLRNKRVLLAYTHARLQNVKAMRWSLGRALPEHVLVQLSAQEKEFFKDYDRVVMKYMKDVCDGLPLDITLDQRPPPAKDNNIRVRVITEPENDIGEITIRDTQYNLVSGSEHFMPLEEAEKLIREGVLQHAVV